jgi:antitoxin PrlF
MPTSKITTNGRTTISQPVRTALRVWEGDEIAYTFAGDKVILTRARRTPADDPIAKFDEWTSDSDRQVYADL